MRKWSAAILLSAFVVACGGGSPTGPTNAPANQPPPALTLQIWTVEGYRWAAPGGYGYDVTYRFRNTFTEPVTIAVTGAVLIGPNGETLSGIIPSSRMPAPKVASPGVYTNYFQDLTVNDPDDNHPYAERLRLTVSYQVAGASQTTEVTEEVLHYPLTLPPPQPTPPPAAPTQSSTFDLRVSEAIATRYPNPYPGPPRINYSVCGQFTNIGGQDVVMRRLEVAATGPDGDHYPVQQDWGNLKPGKYAPGGTRFGCIAGAVDYDMSHGTPARVRLILFYTLPDGRVEIVEASTTNIR